MMSVYKNTNKHLILIFYSLVIAACGGDGGSNNGNSIPVAISGAHQNVTTGSLVILDGSDSSDSDADNLTYDWSFIYAPAGSSAAILDPNMVTPSFTADADGIYVIDLTVNDGKTSSNIDTVVVFASSNTRPMILVDASRDGGAWWFPQAGPFNAENQHQGKALADHLKSLNFDVIELPRNSSITMTTELLRPFKIVVRAGGFRGNFPEEIDAYRSYTNGGGSLLLLTEFQRQDETDSLALSFGISFQGISRGDNLVDRFAAHPITAGVSVMSYGVGSAITGFPVSANILGYLSANTYLDLNDNNVQDTAEEPTGAPVLGEMSFGAGKIIFSGDINMWEAVPQPLVNNSINWLASP